MITLLAACFLIASARADSISPPLSPFALAQSAQTQAQAKIALVHCRGRIPSNVVNVLIAKSFLRWDKNMIELLSLGSLVPLSKEQAITLAHQYGPQKPLDISDNAFPYLSENELLALAAKFSKEARESEEVFRMWISLTQPTSDIQQMKSKWDAVPNNQP